MSNFILHILKLNLLAAGCILLILILSKILEHRYSVRWRYFLWMIISITLMLPIQLPSRTAIIKVEVPHTTALEPQQISQAETSQTLLPDSNFSSQPYTRWNLKQVFLFVWIGIALILLIFRLLQYHTEYKNLVRWSTPIPNRNTKRIYKQICEKDSLLHAPRLVMNTKISTPLLAGIFSPVLYLPDCWYSNDELEIIFAHELCHYHSRDILYKSFLLLVTTVYWFNPLLYKMTKEAERDIEYLCDDKVTTGKDKNYRILYNQLLLKTAVSSKKHSHYLYASLNDSTSRFKQRLLNIMKMKSVKKGVIPAITIACIFISCNVFLGFSMKVPNLVNAATQPEETIQEENPDVLYPREFSQQEDQEPIIPDVAEISEIAPTEVAKDVSQESPTIEAPVSEVPSVTPEPTPSVTVEQPVTSTIQVYTGSYIDNKRYNPENTDSYCEIYVSNITSNSFDFTIYELNDAQPDQKTLLLDTNTAIFSENSSTAIATVNGQTVAFCFPDSHNSYPVATDMQVLGIDSLEGNSYANNSIPGYEFG